MKSDEMDLLLSFLKPKDIKEMAKEHGWDDKRIKADL